MKINLRDKALLSIDEHNEHIYHIMTRGFSILPNFLRRHECELLKASMEQSINDFKPVVGSERSFLDRFQMHDLLSLDINYGRLLEDPRLQQLLSPHLGEHWIMYAATSSSIPPEDINYSSRLHVDCPRFHPGYIFNMGVIWTLDDYTSENGALKVLPGSQHSETEPSESLFDKNCVDVICKAGTLIVFNAKLYHRTSKNNTNHWRHSMTLNACRSFMKQRMDWVRYLPEEITAQLNPQARRLIGFDTRLPTSLEEFFVPDEHRLYKPNQG